jgi:hypothetical protein
LVILHFHLLVICIAVGLEGGALSLVRINEEVFERKVVAPV